MTSTNWIRRVWRRSPAASLPESRAKSYTPAPDLDAEKRKVLKACLNPDGSIKQIPQQPAKLRVILDYLINAFTPGVIYTEKEVNMIIKRFNPDVVGLAARSGGRGPAQARARRLEVLAGSAP